MCLKIKLFFLLFLMLNVLSAAQLSKEGQLFDAASRGDLLLVQKALKNGANLNQSSRTHAGILQIAAAGGHAEIVNELLKAGALIDARDGLGTALHHAVKNKKIEVVKLLLEANAEVNLRGFADRMPLYIAIKNKDKDAVKILLQFGANYRVLDFYGNSPLDIIDDDFLDAFKNEIELLTNKFADVIFSMVPVKPVAKIIAQYIHGIEKLPKPNIVNNAHNQLIDALNDHSDINLAKLKKVLDKPVSVNLLHDAQHSFGYVTPLALACTYNLPQAVKLLVRAKADIDYPITHALSRACECNDTDIVKFLLDSNASILTTSYYSNALEGAILNQSIESVSLLLEHNKKTGEVDISKLYYGDKKIALMQKGEGSIRDQIIDLVAANFNEYANAISTSYKADMPMPLVKLVMSYMFWHTRYLESDRQMEVQRQQSRLSRCVIA